VDVDPEGMEILPILGSRDPRIEQIGLLLKEEIEAEGLLGGRLYAESLTTALAISLIRDHSSREGRPLGSSTRTCRWPFQACAQRSDRPH
jgi:hypothetical protein